MSKKTLVEILLTGSLLFTPETIPQLKQQDTVQYQNISFERAKFNSNLRTEYLRQLNSKITIPEELDGLQYLDQYAQGRLNKVKVPMRTYILSTSEETSSFQVITQIYRQAFETFSNEEELLSALVDHEFYHAKQIRGSIDFKNLTAKKFPKVFSEMQRIFSNATKENTYKRILIMEVMAYDNQIEKFNTYPHLSKKFKRDMINSYNIYVRTVNKQPDTELFKYMKQTYQIKK